MYICICVYKYNTQIDNTEHNPMDMINLKDMPISTTQQHLQKWTLHLQKYFTEFPPDIPTKPNDNLQTLSHATPE